MNIIIRLRRIAALSLAFATVPVHAMGNQAEPLPLKLVLTNECGTAKNEALETFKGRPLSWCPFDGTKLTAGTNDAAALAGRRLYVSMDLEPARQSKLPIGLILSTFNGTWQVKTHIGAFFQVTEGRIEASVYVPDDAENVYWILSSGPSQAPSADLVIRDAQASVSEARFRPGQMCAPCRQYLDEVMERVRREFLFADRIQLKELESALTLAATGAQDIRELDGPMKELARQLGAATAAAGLPPHGSYLTKAEFALNASAVPPSPALQLHELKADAPLFETRLLDKRVGYIRLRTFLQIDFTAGETYARALRNAIVSLHREGANRWILDLREHAGGTLFPAIAALRPLLGNGGVGYFVDASGKQHSPWLWGVPGLPREMSGAYFTDQDPAFDGEKEATAILLGPVTASSGEMVAIAFHGRSNTRSFGTPTAGYTTAVSGSTDRYGNFFGIASGYATDRNGQRIFPKVVPDVLLAGQPELPDPALSAAISWLGTQQ